MIFSDDVEMLERCQQGLARDVGPWVDFTTLQDIADVAGFGVRSLYSYFPSKIHLLYTVIEPWQQDAFERLEKHVRKLKSPANGCAPSCWAFGATCRWKTSGWRTA